MRVNPYDVVMALAQETANQIDLRKLLPRLWRTAVSDVMIMRSAKILTSLILIALCPPITLPAAKTCKAASTPRVHSRISPELVQRIKSDSGAERVRIVIQLDDSPLSELNALLIGLGAN